MADYSFHDATLATVERQGADLILRATDIYDDNDVPLEGTIRIVDCRTIVADGRQFVEIDARWHGEEILKADVVRISDDLQILELVLYKWGKGHEPSDVLAASITGHRVEVSFEAPADKPPE